MADARSERTEGSPASAALNVARADAPATHATPVAPAVTPEQLTAVVQRTCVVCHNDQLQTGNLSLQNFAVEKADQNAVTAERMIQKLRAGMMPPPGMPRPAGDTMQALVETLETIVDQAAAKVRGATDRPFQRLNRAEYESSVKEVLGLEIDAGDYLPLDT